jgi:arginyl-tRNA synthetase
MNLSPPELSLLGTEELALIKLASQFSRIVESAAQSHEPHRIAFYLGDLAAAFHAFWNMGNDRPELRMVIVGDAATTSARLFLAGGIGQIVRNGLALMGVQALSEMQ